jgi:glucose/arabinose dehydrogenase
MASFRRRVLAVLMALALAGLPAVSGSALAGPIPADGVSRVTLAAPSSARIALQLLASGLSKPVFITPAPDTSGRLFIVEQSGQIRIHKSGSLLATPFLSISSLVSKGYEQGLLGLAFHPKFTMNRKFYVNYTDVNGATVIREYAASAGNANVVDMSTARTLMRIGQPYANHNGGMIAFGPDGYLYIGMGDGGSSGDPLNKAQNTSSLLGKMLRINVNGTTSTKQYRIPTTNPYVGVAGLDEIWQRGLRNPWRFSFDRANGNLWIGDVGQSKYEEIDRAIRTTTGPGKGINWGWRVMEGRHCFNPSSGCSTSGKTLPVVEYEHGSGRCSVTGGYVYRGSAIPALVGGYLFADYCSGEIWVITSTAAAPAAKTRLLDTSMVISSFGESSTGELFVIDHGGAVYRIVQG